VARTRGANVTCGISVNHLTLNENDIGEYRTFFKLSPPLRGEDDRTAMIAGARRRNDRHHRLLARSAGRRHQAAALCGGRRWGDRAGNAAAAALRLHHSGEVSLIRADRRHVDAPRQDLRPRRRQPEGRFGRRHRADRSSTNRSCSHQGRNRLALQEHPFEDARFQGRVLQTMVAGRTVFTAQ
jgi:dihydroorotase